MKAIGLMAGTSLDGIDAALVELGRRPRLLGFHSLPYDAETLAYIREASDPERGTVDGVARLNFYLGELLAAAVIGLLKKTRTPAAEVAFIGSHGQTIRHLPAARKMGRHQVRATLQIGEPSIIAARTGITVVADFRPADIAAGGSGAPLVPYVDYLLLRHARRTRLVINLGGIANFTLLPAGIADPRRVAASDAGPGNMVSDELVRRMTRGAEAYDHGGRYATSGTVDRRLLRRLLARRFFAAPPPKSTGREEFGAGFVDAMLALRPARRRQDWLDLIATAAALTSSALAAHLARFHPGVHPDELIVSGGGIHNAAIMAGLAKSFVPARVVDSGAYGIPPQAKEAIAFALLARETLRHRPANLPSATGAHHLAILGKIVPAPRKT
jgi:anhydro-N-acetylmuramic acid kinase